MRPTVLRRLDKAICKLFNRAISSENDDGLSERVKEKVLICPDCGTQNPPSNKYCSNCGRPIGAGAVGKKKSAVTGAGVASLVMGIIGLIVFAIILGPLAIVLGAIAWSKDNDKLGLAGLILGIIDVIAWLIIIVSIF